MFFYKKNRKNKKIKPDTAFQTNFEPIKAEYFVKIRQVAPAVLVSHQRFSRIRSF